MYKSDRYPKTYFARCLLFGRQVALKWRFSWVGELSQLSLRFSHNSHFYDKKIPGLMTYKKFLANLAPPGNKKLKMYHSFWVSLNLDGARYLK